MSQALVDQHTVVSVSMAGQHASHSLEHGHSLAEHAAHSMLGLSETSNTLEHLAGGGHSSQSLVDMTSGRTSDQSMDSVSVNGRRQPHALDRMNSLVDGNNQSMRQISGNERDISALASNGNGSSNNLITRPLSGLGRSSMPDRQVQPMRNLTPVGTDGMIGQLGGGLSAAMSSDGQGSVGVGGQAMTGGSSGNGLQESGSSNHRSLSFSPEHPSQNLLDSLPTLASRSQQPSMSGAQHNLDHQHGTHSLSSHLRGLSDHSSHAHLVDHHAGDAGRTSHNGQDGMSVFGLNNSGGQLHSRPGSTLLPEASGHGDARDLSQSVYSTSSASDGRLGNHQSASLIEKTIASVASNFNKSSPDGGIMPGPLPPNSLLGLGSQAVVRSSSVVTHLGHGDESLVDLVGRHHSQSVPMLSERVSQSLSGLMDEHSMNQSPGHSQGRELEKTHPCLTCLKLFRSKQQLAQHSLVHTGIRKHVCSFCDRAFKQLSHLQQHVRIHTGQL